MLLLSSLAAVDDVCYNADIIGVTSTLSEYLQWDVLQQVQCCAESNAISGLVSDTSTSGTALRIRWTELWAVFNYSEATEVCQPARQGWTKHREDVVKMKKEMYPGSHKSSMSEILRCDFSSTAWGPLDSADNKVLRLWGWQQEDFHFQGEASSFLLKVTRLKRNSCEVVEPRLNAKAIGRKGCIGQAAEGWTQIKTARVLTFCLITENTFQFHKSWWWYWY